MLKSLQNFWNQLIGCCFLILTLFFFYFNFTHSHSGVLVRLNVSVSDISVEGKPAWPDNYFMLLIKLHQKLMKNCLHMTLQ